MSAIPLRTWCEQFLLSVGSGGAYETYMGDFEILLNECLETGEIKANKEDATFFLHEFCGSLASAFMRIQRLAESELVKIMKTIEKLVSLYTNALCYGENEFAQYILQLYVYDSVFFEKNDIRVDYTSAIRTKVLYTQFVDYFFGEPIEKLKGVICKNPTFSIFNFCALMFKAFNNCASEEKVNLFVKDTTQSLISMLDDLSNQNLRDIDNQTLIDVLKASTKWTSASIYTLKAAESCLMSGFLEKQIIGARIISQFAELNDQTYFKEWCKNASFFDMLLKGDIHPELLTVLSPAFVAYFTLNNRSNELTTTIWARARNSHTALKEPFYKLIANILSKDPKTTKSFLADVQTRTADRETILFLLQVLGCWNDFSDEIPKDTIRFGLSFIENPQTQSIGEEFAEQLGKTSPVRFATIISNIIIEKIENGTNDWPCIAKLAHSKIMETQQSKILVSVLQSFARGEVCASEVFQSLDISESFEVIEKYFTKAIPAVFQVGAFSPINNMKGHNLHVVKEPLIKAWIEALMKCDLSKASKQSITFAYKCACSYCHVGYGFFEYQYNLNFQLLAFEPLIGIAEQGNEIAFQKASILISRLAFLCKGKSFSELFEYIADLKSVRRIMLLEQLILRASFVPGQVFYQAHGEIRPHVCDININNSIRLIVDRSFTIQELGQMYIYYTHSTPSFKYDNSILSSTATIEELALPQKCTLEATLVSEVAPSQSVDSIAVLLRMGVREKLFAFLDDDIMMEAAYKAIILLPSINCDDLLQSIKTENGYKLRYHLHYCVRKVDPEITESIIEAIAEKRIFGFGITEACNAIMAHPSFMASLNGVFVSSVFSTLVSRIEYDYLLVECAVAAIRAFPETISPESLQQIITQRSDLLEKLTPAMIVIPNKSVFFNQLVKSASNEANYNMLTALVDNSCDVTEAISLITTKVHGSDALIDLFIAILKTHENNLSDQEIKPAFNAILEELPKKAACNAISMLSQNPCFQPEITKKLLDICDITSNRWGYDPSDNLRSSCGFTGLRNLGATCYMNSVIQALFQNVAFRNAVYSEIPSQEWIGELQKLFYRMELTELPSVDTQPFASKWHFYGNEPLNPREQQDAVEFIQLLLDRIKAGKLYEGITVTKMEAENQTVNEREETFHTLSLEVKNCNSITDSFSVYLQNEIIEDYFAESLGRKVDVERYSRIRQCPPYLVIQLKRFDFDLETFQRIKVNGKFIVPYDIDVSPISENSATYKLVGAVVHTGTAQGGHYTANMKYGNDWIKFNDNTVTDISKFSFETEVYGVTHKETEISSINNDYSYFGDFDSHDPSGYLLFYTKTDISEEQTMHACPDDLKDEIEKENQQYTRTQNAFSPNLLTMVLQMNNPELFQQYFFNVFIHMKPVIAELPIAETFHKLLPDFNPMSYKDIIFQLLLECQVEAVVSTIKTIVISSISPEFADFLFSKLEEVEKNWRCLPALVSIIIALDKLHHDYFIENHYPERILDFCTQSLARSKSSIYLQNADFSSIASLLSSNKELCTIDVLSTIVSAGGLLIQSSMHSSIFISIIQDAAKEGKIVINDFIKNIINDSKDPNSSALQSMFITCIQNTKTKEELWDIASLFIFSPKVSKESLVKGLMKAISEQNTFPLREIFTMRGGKVLFYLSTCDDSSSRGAMEPCYLRFFKSVDGMSGCGRAELLLSSTTEVGLCWKETDRASLSAEERPCMETVLNAIIDGFEEIAKDPRETIKGKDANIRLLIQLRVMLYMALRTGNMSFHGWEVMFDLVKALASLKIVDDLNGIEIIRIFHACKKDTAEILRPRFKELIEGLFAPPASDSIAVAKIAVVLWFLDNFFTPELLKWFFDQEYVKKYFEIALQHDAEPMKCLTNLTQKEDLVPAIKEVLTPYSTEIFETCSEKGTSLIIKLGIIPPELLAYNSFRQGIKLIADMDPYQIQYSLVCLLKPKIFIISGKKFELNEDIIHNFETALNKFIKLSLNHKSENYIGKFLATCCNHTELLNIVINAFNNDQHQCLIYVKSYALLFHPNPQPRFEMGSWILKMGQANKHDFSECISQLFELTTEYIKLDGLPYHSRWAIPFLSLSAALTYWSPEVKSLLALTVPILSNAELSDLVSEFRCVSPNNLYSNPQRISFIARSSNGREEFIAKISGVAIEQIPESVESIYDVDVSNINFDEL